MSQIILDAEAGTFSAELMRRGVAADAHAPIVVDILDTGTLPMAAITQAGKAFDWLNEEPALHADVDLVERVR